MNEMNDGGPAFPVNPEVRSDEEHAGMSLRDWFAGMAMQGALAGSLSDGSALLLSDHPIIARTAYSLADAMLVERSKQ